MYALPFISTTTSKKPKHEQKNKHNAKKDKYFSTKIFEQRFAIYFFHNHILNESQAHKYRCTRTHSLTHAYTYSLSLPPRSCSSPSLPHSPVRITAIPPASAILTWLSALKARFLFFFSMSIWNMRIDIQDTISVFRFWVCGVLMRTLKVRFLFSLVFHAVWTCRFVTHMRTFMTYVYSHA